MEIRKYESAERAMEVAKEAMWLAWQACGGTSGMGFFQDNPTAQKDAEAKPTGTAAKRKLQGAVK